MKNMYRKLIIKIEKSMVKLHILKTWIFEWLSIIRKKDQYKDIVWSKEQQTNFDKFWLDNYGKKSRTNGINYIKVRMGYLI